MKKVGESLEFSATDLVGYLNCRHLADLDRAVAEGTLPKPKVWDPLLEILSERGAAHEQNYIEHLTKSGLEVARIDGGDITKDSVGATLSAMRRGVPVIAQAALSGSSSGRSNAAIAALYDDRGMAQYDGLAIIPVEWVCRDYFRRLSVRRFLQQVADR